MQFRVTTNWVAISGYDKVKLTKTLKKRSQKSSQNDKIQAEFKSLKHKIQLQTIKRKA